MISVKPRLLPSLFSPLTFSLPKPKFPTLITMSTTTTSSSPPQLIEHIVLFKVKPSTPPSTVTTMLTSLNSLISLPSVLHLTTSPILRTNSPFTHLLHSRYPSVSALSDYSSHPQHLGVVRESVLPICDDIMSLDWISTNPGIVHCPVVEAGKAVKVTFLKLKEGLGEEEKAVVLGVIGGLKGKVGGGLEVVSFGENFSPGRAKGFGIGSIAVFGGKEEMEAAEKEEVVGVEKEKVRELLEEIVVVEFIVPEKEGLGFASL